MEGLKLVHKSFDIPPIERRGSLFPPLESGLIIVLASNQ